MAKPNPREGEIHRLVVVIGAVVFLDTLFYAVISPLLPELSHQLRLSKLSAGVLTASYPAGMLIGSVPGGVLVMRAGSRFTVGAGLVLLGCSTIGFAFLNSTIGLDLARLVEGLGGACTWAGGLSWIVTETPADRRGTMMGGALAAAIGGALFGPALGAVASATGRPPLFTGVAVVAAALLAVTLRLPYRREPSGRGLEALAGVLRRPVVLAGIWLMTLPAIASGMISVLAPLRLHRFGAGAGVIGLTFLVAAGLEAAISPAIGRISDRHGRIAPLRLGLLGAGAALVCFTLPQTEALLSVIVVLTACVLGAFWAPAMAMLSDAAENHDLDQGLAAALMNFGWAGGQIIGSAAGGAAAKAAGDGPPTIAVAGLCALTLSVLVTRSGLRRRPALTTGPS